MNYQNFEHCVQMLILNIYYLHYLLEIYIVNYITQILTFFQNNDNDFLQVFKYFFITWMTYISIKF